MTENTIRITRIDESQAELVTGLFDKYRVFYKKPSDIAVARRFIHERLSKNESVVFVALAANDLPVGFTQLYPAYSSVRVVKNWILNDLYVEAAYRKQGVGRHLINTAIDFAKEHDAAYVELSTGVDNYAAQRLYEKIGFQQVPADTSYFNYRIMI